MLTNAPIDFAEVSCLPGQLALAVVIVGETVSASSVSELTFALRASWAVTISRLTPTAIAAPTPAEAPIELPFAVVVIVALSLASISSAPGTTRVVGSASDFRHRLVPRERDGNGRRRGRGRNVGAGVAHAWSRVRAVGQDGDRALAGDRGGTDVSVALIERGVGCERGTEAEHWVCGFGRARSTGPRSRSPSCTTSWPPPSVSVAPLRLPPCSGWRRH